MKDELRKLYRARFAPDEMAKKNEVWRILCRHYFQGMVKETDAVVDLGAGYCEFINSIKCRRKIAVDVNEDIRAYAGSDVEICITPCARLGCIGSGSVDVVFISNLLEHLETKKDVSATLHEVFRILRATGKAIILQPNVRFLQREYWDFFDHLIPLSDRSLVEVLNSLGFRCTRILPRFLPYTTKNAPGVLTPFLKYLIPLYLRLSWLQRLCGRQMLIIAEK